jgi:NTP pyrophosphatase (non-canonical NTP hydrolase)
MNKPFDLPAEIQLHLPNDYKEDMKVTPSYYALEAYAPKILELTTKWKEIQPEIADELYSLERRIKLFQIDLPGHLKDDLKKGNKRYKPKWQELKDNIETIKRELLKLWKEKNII